MDMMITNVKSTTMGVAVTSASRQKEVKPNDAAPAPVKEIEKNQQESRAGPVSREETKEIVKSLNGHMNLLQTTLNFRISEETDQIIVRVVNRETNELIRQIPPEELVTLQAKMEELTGIIFDKIV